MKTHFIKTYLYWLVIIAAINLLSGVAYILTYNLFIYFLVFLATLMEIPVLILSVIMLIKSLKYKWPSIYVVIPFLYLLFSISLAISGSFTDAKTIDAFDLNYLPNLLIFIICIIFYLAQIIAGVYLLRKGDYQKLIYTKKPIISQNPAPENKATISLILGIIGMIFWIIPIIGLPVQIIGLIKGIKSMKSEKRSRAIAGITLCIIGIVLSIINASIGAYMGVTGQFGF